MVRKIRVPLFKIAVSNMPPRKSTEHVERIKYPTDVFLAFHDR